ncbi:flavodoxin family protein [Alkaliphilus pronyensis]|uniref:Flavodoxin family protein n=1 Tax=Alkaliphilus pronyensis TaxID=1482732 RepID=A0A6I0F7S0_9FIRM|nr:flavodoxin family protein [Alkaliphilus pronyensis]KAB3533472.1 flavodoxin family protein [Alkaliphilus pronyensis]
MIQTYKQIKITAFNGSPRGVNGNTNKMIVEILNGAKEVGAEIENILLSEYNINHCIGCFSCWVNKGNRCRFNDDMQLLLTKYYTSDVVIYGTPLYMDNVSGILKAFIDRSIAIICPYMEKDNAGEYRHVRSKFFKEPPKFVVVSNGAFPENSQFQVVAHYFNRLARSMDTEVIGEIYRGQGLLLALPKHDENRQIIDNYNTILNRAGRDIAEKLELKDQTKRELVKPLVPYDVYIKNIERYWRKVLEG